MQNLFTIILCVSWKQLFFSCCLVCIYMTRAFRCQYALETKPVYRLPTLGVDIPCHRCTGFRRHREVCAKPAYRRPTPQGSLRNAGIQASDVLRVKIIRPDITRLLCILFNCNFDDEQVPTCFKTAINLLPKKSIDLIQMSCTIIS